MHQIIVGIEHLMTGVQFMTDKDSPLTFTQESASTVKVTCRLPFVACWPVKQIWLDSQEVPGSVSDNKPPRPVEWFAKKVVEAMRKVDDAWVPLYRANAGFDSPLPTPAVITAMRVHFGEHADHYIGQLRYYNPYWGFTHAGMFIGVEPDGYMHS